MSATKGTCKRERIGGSLMKRAMALPVLGLCLVILVGCGGNDNRNSNASATSTDNWQLGGAGSTVPQLGGALALTNSTISGSMPIIDGSYDSGSCFTPDQLFSLSGTVDPQGNISGTASSGSGLVMIFTGVLDSSRSSISLGNYTFNGGCADGDSGPLAGVRFKPVTGIYVGTLGDTAVSANLTQSNLGQKLNGYLHLSGTVTYTGPTCSEVFTIEESSLAGSYIQLSLTAKDGTSTSVGGHVVDSTASQLDLADYEGGCGSGGYGTLIQQ